MVLLFFSVSCSCFHDWWRSLKQGRLQEKNKWDFLGKKAVPDKK